MNKNKIEEHLSTYKGSEGSYPVSPESLTYKAMGKKEVAELIIKKKS